MKIGNFPIENDPFRVRATASEKKIAGTDESKRSIRKDTFDMSSISKLMAKASGKLTEFTATVRQDKVNQFKHIINDKDFFQDRIIDRVLTKMSE